jgi:hypothetical protein
MLFLRRDRAEPLIVLPWRVWARLVDAITPISLRAALASVSASGCDGTSRPASASAAPAERAVVADDGQAIRLMLYGGANTAAAVRLAPLRAVAIAGELIAAALPKMR